MLAILFCAGFIEVASFYIVKYNFSYHAFENREVVWTTSEFSITGKFNEFGFRDESFLQEEDATISVAMVGDSFTFGEGVQKNQTFEFLIEESFNETNLPVYNLGFSGGDMADYKKIIDEMFPLLKPKQTFIFLYLENDIQCKNTKRAAKYFFPNLRVVIKRLFNAWSDENEKRYLLKSDKLTEEYKRALESSSFETYFIRKSIYKPNKTQEYESLISWFEACPANKEEMKMLQKTVQEYGSSVIFVLIPPAYQVTSQNWETLEELDYSFDKKLLNDSLLQEQILVFCEENQMVCINLLPMLRQSAVPVYYFWDPHFNQNGTMLVAETVYRELR